MSTVRIQLRRGLEADWTSADTALNSSGGLVLAGGEVGLETDTGKFKFGDGTTRWSVLPYALENTLGDYVLISEIGVANGVAGLNSSGKVPASQLDISELSQDAVNTALVAGTGIAKSYDDSNNTITLSLNASTSNVSEGTNLYFTDERAQDAVNTAIVAGTNISKSYNDAANTLTISMPNDIVLSGYVDANQILGNSGAIDGELTAGSLIVSGNLTVNGTTTTVNSTTLVVDDPIIKIADGNSANSVDIGFAGSRTIGGTYSHTGLVKDATDGVWKLFSGVSTEPGSTVDFTTWTKDNLHVGELYADAIYMGDVSNTEIGYLNGVTSAIQTQIDSKLASSTASSTYAPLANPTFTGTVAGITNTMVGLGNVDNTSDANKPVSTATQTALDLKSPLAGPVFTGTVILPSTTSIGDVSSTEIGYVNGVTSSIQTQLDQKTTDLSNHSLDSTSVHGIADTAQLATKTYADSAVSTHQSDSTNIHGIADTANLVTLAGTEVLTNKTIALGSNTVSGTTAQFNSAITDGDFATLAGIETFTNKTLTAPAISNPTGLVKADVGLANVDNTSDASKPVSTATQSALNLKANLAAPTFTGTVVLPSTTSIGNVSATELGYVDGVTSAIQTQLNAKAPLASPALTGTPTAPTATPGTNSTQVATTAYADAAVAALVDAAPGTLNTLNELAAAINDDASFASTVTASLGTKAPSAGPTFTGTVTLPSTTSIGTVSDTEIGYLDGVTSAVQTQLNAKAPLASPTFTGTVTLPTGTVTSAMIADGTIVDGDINAAAAINLSKLASGTSGQIIVANSSGVPTWVSESGDVTISNTGVTAIASGVIVDADINASAAIDKTKISGTAITAGDTGTVTSTMIADGTIVNGDINASAAIDWTKLAISSTVSATELGYVDGVTSSIQTQINAQLPKSGGTMTGALTLSGAPTSDLHAATKLYVDNVTAGINFHEAVHAASTANLATVYNNGTSGVGATLTADTNRAFSTLDGESVVLGQRVLIKNQTDAKQNGIYTLTTVGSVSAPWVLTRATDADNNPTGEMKIGDFTFVQNGTVNASVGYINNSATNPIVIGTDNISYTEFNAGKTVVAGSGLTEATPGTISVATGGITSGMIADGAIVDADVNASAAIAQSKISGLTTDLAAKAPLASPTFTGTVTLPTGTVTSGMILDGTILNADINASAAIDKTKISGTAITAGDTGTVTSTMIADGTIVNGDINASAAIALSKLASGTSGQIIVANASGVPTWVSKSGDVTISNTGVTAIASGVIVDADVNASAAIAQSKIANLTTDLAAKAPLASPALTGTPTAPTATAGTNTTQVATTAFVGTAVANLVASAPSTLDTLNELATALGNDASFSTTVTNSLAAKAPLAGPTFTGTVVLPSTTSIGNVTSTEIGYVDGVTSAIQTQLDSKLATATASSTYAPIASPTFTGTVTVAASGVAFTDGTQTKEGVASRTPIIQKTAAYTLSALTERDSLIEVSSATGVTVSIPTDATLDYPIGTSIDILQTGSGQVTIAAVTPGTTTVNGTPGLKLRTQWSSCTLFKRAANTWVVMGDLSA